MSSTPPDEIFGPLKRRDGYSTKLDGSYYSYAHFRTNFHHEIAIDCLCRCVYCDSHEDVMGGRASMQIDHFRPRSRTEFTHLENDPKNFNHACARCNLLKSDHWPCSIAGLCHDNNVGFIDPFDDIRSDYFKVKSDGEIVPIKAPAKYIIGLLALNRPYLKKMRVRRMLQNQLREYIDKVVPVLEASRRGEGTLPDGEAERIAYTLVCALPLLCNL